MCISTQHELKLEINNGKKNPNCLEIGDTLK